MACGTGISDDVTLYERPSLLIKKLLSIPFEIRNNSLQHHELRFQIKILSFDFCHLSIRMMPNNSLNQCIISNETLFVS